VDVDALCDGKQVYVAGIMEHIEEAGIHSGDSACSLPPYSLGNEMIADIREQTTKLARALHVVGLMNVQFAIKDGDIYILEVNPRASRTVPFVAKATNIPVAKIAARLMAGEKLDSFNLPPSPALPEGRPKHIAVKEAVFPFDRFPGVDVLLGPEMKSTGEVMGIDNEFALAFAKAYIATGSKIPLRGTAFISVRDADKNAVVPIARQLDALGFTILATGGTQRFLEEQGVAATRINKVREGRPHIVDLLKDNKVELVINTTEGVQSITDSFSIRRTALQHKITYCTTMEGSRALVAAMDAIKNSSGLEVRSLQSYFS